MNSMRLHSLKNLKASDYITFNRLQRIGTDKCIHSGNFYQRSESGFFKNLRQPYKSVLIFLVGRSQCAEAVENLKEMTFCLARLIVRQCKVHAGQKLQQSLHFYSFYSRMWGEEMTRKMVSGIQKSLLQHGKHIIMSAICLLPYDWDINKISEQKLESSVEELNSVGDLCSATVYCQDCQMRRVIDKKLPNVEYCTCKGSIAYTDNTHLYDSWEPFLERENIIVWRKPNENSPHLYSYKVYGTYDDMSLSAFMEVQLNTTFRTVWDSTALELKVMSSQPEYNSDLIYWCVKFPQFFANRDYVFKRRYKVNEKKKEVVIISELADHDKIPEVAGLHRVCDYWSIMVIRAHTNFNEPGMSYTLTYFDNPGTSLPAVVTNFIATTAFPDYLKRVYDAAMSLQQRWVKGEDVYVTLPANLRFSTRVDVPEIIVPERDLKEVVPILDSDQFATEKRDSHFKAITESFENNNGIEIENRARIPLKYKKVIVDLLEAMEVVPPDLIEKTKLASKIEELVNKLNLDKGKKAQLIKKLSNIKLKTKKLWESSKKEKESMKDLDVKRSYYDHVDEPTFFMIKGLFKAINDVLEMDKNMRIGKELFNSDTSPTVFKDNRILKDDNSSKRSSEMDINDQDRCVNENFKNDSKPESYKNVDIVHDIALCACCACDQSISTPWYSFNFISYWWGYSSSSDDNNFCDKCVCEHKSLQSSTPTINSQNNKTSNVSNFSPPNLELKLTEEQKIVSNFSYWQYLYFWSYVSYPTNWFTFFFWPSSVNSNGTCNDNTDHSEHDTAQSNKDSTLEVSDSSNSVHWYWVPVRISYNFIIWIFGTTKEPV